MFKVDFIVLICFVIILETSKPENSFLFSFLKSFTMNDHLIVLKKINQKSLLKPYHLIDFHKSLVIFKPEIFTKY